ncbi:MAG: TetR/AcrR family transcriptional regulator [Alphaproteobacteria bacterium]|nr:TetR/AcrR family transcriptional regulator [Alphaproteobacteria bacterium]MCB9698159.1 TetR/AcrR family transcriptional regulator [Alphaproteobacteria bacterium]
MSAVDPVVEGRTEMVRKILDLGERFVMQRGYHAFSYQHVAEELDVKPAAVHYHFRTKPDLVAAVLDRYHARFHRWAEARRDAPPMQRLVDYVQLSRDIVAAERVCALGMMATQFGTVPEEVQDRTMGLQAEIFGWLESMLEEGRAQGVFAFQGSASARAAELGCTVLGAQQLGRVRGPEAFEAVAAQIPRSLAAT